MSGNYPGMKKKEFDTPALCLDIENVEKNLNNMANFFSKLPASLRPHFKTHKSPILAQMQLEAGAIGITCAKLGEAEILAQAGIKDILIANQIVDPLKIVRLINLSAYTEVMVAVDSVENIVQLDSAASEKGVRLRVLIEIDIGMGRCGVAPGKNALSLAHEIISSSSLRFEGLMGYEGHAVMISDPVERKRTAEKAMALLVTTASVIRESGIPVRVVSGGGTGTYAISGQYPGVTDIQAGSYLTMDSQYHENVGIKEFNYALTLITTVIHINGDRAITDAGMKSLSADFGMPIVINPAGWGVSNLAEEHGFLKQSGGSRLRSGDKVEIVPSHGCTTINLHDVFHVVRNGKLEAIWPISGRGKSN